ncbi:MAG TPA: hypothetical protein PLF40_00555 [Kofleriaceae bacterium]|nr:hypothetical protein [Kofleriaceae bacterium]
MTKPPKVPVWRKPKPATAAAAPKQKLSESQIAAARARAEAAGRRYPNLVDNMWAAKQPRD